MSIVGLLQMNETGVINTGQNGYYLEVSVVGAKCLSA